MHQIHVCIYSIFLYSILYNVFISSNCSTFAGTPLLESVGLHEPFVESLRDTIKRAIQQVYSGQTASTMYCVVLLVSTHVTQLFFSYK